MRDLLKKIDCIWVIRERKRGLIEKGGYMKIFTQRGSFAFEYNNSLAIDDIKWFKRFEIFVPGSILPEEIIKEYKEAGTKLFFYEWVSAFWDNQVKNEKWLLKVLNEHPDWLLNPEGSLKAGSSSLPAWYWDPANEESAACRINYLAEKLDISGYDGIFFDCIGTFDKSRDSLGNNLQVIYDEYYRRHPDISYAEAFGGFLGKLKAVVKDKKLFTNQGYRNAEHYLPFSDYDLCESYMTGCGKIDEPGKSGITRFNPWYNETEKWVSSRFIIRHCIVDKIAAKRVSPEILHLNYCHPIIAENTGSLKADREAIYYAFCVAKMFDHTAYVQCQQMKRKAVAALNHDEIYFVNLGKPIETGVFIMNDTLAVREFENGFVIVNGSVCEQEIDLGVSGKVYDTFTGRFVKTKGLKVPFTRQINGNIAPAGRVYMKAGREEI